MLNGAQIRLRCTPTKTGTLIDLKVAGTFVVPTIEICGGRDARLIGCIAKRVEDLPGQARGLDTPFATGAVEFAFAAVVVFHALVKG